MQTITSPAAGSARLWTRSVMRQSTSSFQYSKVSQTITLSQTIVTDLDAQLLAIHARRLNVMEKDFHFVGRLYRKQDPHNPVWASMAKGRPVKGRSRKDQGQ